MRRYYTTMACDGCGKVVFPSQEDDAIYNWLHLHTVTAGAAAGDMKYIEWDFCSLSCLLAWTAKHEEAKP